MEKPKKYQNLSCHQCKTKKFKKHLVFCSKVKSNKISICKKKYCQSCIETHYAVFYQFNRKFWDNFSCPACLKFCHCLNCSRNTFNKKKNLTIQLKKMLPLNQNKAQQNIEQTKDYINSDPYIYFQGLENSNSGKLIKSFNLSNFKIVETLNGSNVSNFKNKDFQNENAYLNSNENSNQTYNVNCNFNYNNHTKIISNTNISKDYNMKHLNDNNSLSKSIQLYELYNKIKDNYFDYRNILLLFNELLKNEENRACDGKFISLNEKNIYHPLNGKSFDSNEENLNNMDNSITKCLFSNDSSFQNFRNLNKINLKISNKNNFFKIDSKNLNNSENYISKNKKVLRDNLNIKKVSNENKSFGSYQKQIKNNIDEILKEEEISKILDKDFFNETNIKFSNQNLKNFGSFKRGD